jgi:regulator of protease activity HflC (stomatin/prohibitin superfamily)
MRRWCIALAAAWSVAGGVGCGGAVIEPGHRGLYFDPQAGLRQEVLNPGYHSTGMCFLRAACPRIDDFDVTYSTKKEVLHTTSSEGLAMDLHVNVIYRPIIEELYKLDTETGPNYYDEVIGPEFRSAARGVLSRHSYTDLAKSNEKIEDEIEVDLRRRIHGKHIEIASITLEAVSYAPEIAAAVRARIVSEQEAARQRAAMEQEAARQKASLENEAFKRKLEFEHQAAQAKLEAETALLSKENEKKVIERQAEIDVIKAQADARVRIVTSEAAAKEMTVLARAKAEERRAETVSITPLAVMMHAYDALGKLGGTGTTIMLGDFSRTPQFLFPGGTLSPYGLLPRPAMPAAPAIPPAANTRVGQPASAAAGSSAANAPDEPRSAVRVTWGGSPG